MRRSLTRVAGALPSTSFSAASGWGQQARNLSTTELGTRAFLWLGSGAQSSNPDNHQRPDRKSEDTYNRVWIKWNGRVPGLPGGVERDGVTSPLWLARSGYELRQLIDMERARDQGRPLDSSQNPAFFGEADHRDAAARRCQNIPRGPTNVIAGNAALASQQSTLNFLAYLVAHKNPSPYSRLAAQMASDVGQMYGDLTVRGGPIGELLVRPTLVSGLYGSMHYRTDLPQVVKKHYRRLYADHLAAGMSPQQAMESAIDLLAGAFNIVSQCVPVASNETVKMSRALTQSSGAETLVYTDPAFQELLIKDRRAFTIECIATEQPGASKPDIARSLDRSTAQTAGPAREMTAGLSGPAEVITAEVSESVNSAD
jgi:hypothetical protein